MTAGAPAAGRAQHGIRIERLDRKLSFHVHAAIVQPDDRDIVAPPVRVGERAPRPVLAAAVGHVGRMAFREQVVGIDAASLVAAMADVHARRDRPVPERPGKAMRPTRTAADAERAIAAVVDRALPEVTAGDAVDPRVVGKPLLEGPAGPAMNTFFHAGQNTERGSDHLLRAMAPVKWGHLCGFFRGPMPI